MSKSENKPRKQSRSKLAKTALVGLVAIVAILVFVLRPFKGSQTEISTTRQLSTKSGAHPELMRPKLTPTVSGLAAVAEPSAPTYPTLTNVAMRLIRKVLVSKKWNAGADSFGLDKPPAGKEGATVGPAAVTFFKGNLYVLDNPNKQILCYDQAGKLLSSVELPNTVATDLSVDASGSSLVLIDHMHDRIYKIDGNELVLLSSVPLKENFPLGTKFSYDSASETLSTQEVHQDGLCDIDGKNLVLNFKDGGKLGIPFDRPVTCVEEIVTDANGIVWVLYTLEGDYQMRRIARVDRAKGTVGSAEVDVYFAFDATRHMAATGTGIVLFGGDNNEGRLISFNYDGVVAF
ncbi:MAG: hypothetical protein JWM68_5414 [Verrucomicrobiales bacterium]|nr:hypothetical protein [Verrucomicrobiales bacterium]